MPYSNFFDRFKELVVHPSAFFEKAKTEKGIRTSFLVYAGALALNALAGWLVQTQTHQYESTLSSFSSSGVALPSFLQHPTAAMFGELFFANFVWGMLMVFVSAFFLHVWIKMWKGTGNFTDTFHLLAYGMLPTLLLGWIPNVGAVVWIWTLVLNVIAAQKLHAVSRGKAIWIFILPTVLLVVLGGLVAVLFASLIL